MPRHAQQCPGCGAGVTPIAYGFPSRQMAEAADRGEIVLGDCILFGDDPTWTCPACDRLDGPEGELPYGVLIRRAAVADEGLGALQAWSQCGLDRHVVERRGLVEPDLPLLVRGYVSAESGWQDLDDDADGRFIIGVAVLREDGRPPRPVDLGDLVMYLGDVAGCDTPMVWAPALTVRLAPRPPRGRTAWTLTDLDIRSCEGDECDALRSVPDDVQEAVRDLTSSGSPATAKQRHLLLGVFGCGNGDHGS